MESSIVADRQGFSELLLSLEHDLGTRDTCRTFLEALAATLPITAFRDEEDVRKQLLAFYEMFAHLRPRMAIIQNYLDAMVDALLSRPAEGPESLNDRLLRAVGKAAEDNERRSAQLTREGAKLIHNGDRILIHSHSHSVLDALDAAHRAHKRFQVLVAEQEAEKTLDLIRFLQGHGIPFSVVPEYMLSHVEHDITCLLIGAVTLKNDMNFAVNAGTKAVVSEMNSAKIPVYLLLTTNKFSYWRTRAAHQVVRTVSSHAHDGFSYERMKFSHDRLPMAQIDRVITEEGSFTVPELKRRYAELLEDRRRWLSALPVKGLKTA